MSTPGRRSVSRGWWCPSDGLTVRPTQVFTSIQYCTMTLQEFEPTPLTRYLTSVLNLPCLKASWRRRKAGSGLRFLQVGTTVTAWYGIALTVPQLVHGVVASGSTASIPLQDGSAQLQRFHSLARTMDARILKEMAASRSPHQSDDRPWQRELSRSSSFNLGQHVRETALSRTDIVFDAIVGEHFSVLLALSLYWASMPSFAGTTCFIRRRTAWCPRALSTPAGYTTPGSSRWSSSSTGPKPGWPTLKQQRSWIEDWRRPRPWN